MIGDDSWRERLLARWDEIEPIFERALDLDPEARAPFLEQACGGDDELRSELEALIASHESGDSLLDGTAGLHAREALEGATPSRAGVELGAYVLDEEIGRGGMAVVYRAHRADGTFEQQVAVKVLGTGLLQTAGGERFRREQALLGRLRHPNIASMLDGGVADDGTPYLVMELIDGRPIDRHCDEQGATVTERVELLRQVCEATAFAHRNLVVHRDLKPSNVLVTRDGDVKLVDFGIAKLLEADDSGTALTVTGQRWLTPDYAAPEQMSGGEVTTATDVYGLGRVLATLLEQLPAQEADGDLANVVAKATREEPERRYRNAGELAADLERWLDHRPVTATPDSLAYRGRKFVARHRLGVLAAALVLLAIGGGVAATWLQAVRTEAARAETAAINDFLTEMLTAPRPSESGREVQVVDLLEAAVGRLDTLEPGSAAHARVLDVLASTYTALNRWHDAEPLLAQAVAAFASRQDPGDEASLMRRATWAESLINTDRPDEATAILLEVAAAGADRAPLPRSALRAQVLLAEIDRNAGRTVAAERCLRDLLATPVARGLELERGRQAGGALANLLIDAGRFEEALTILEPLVEQSRQGDAGRFGPVTMSLTNAMATALHNLRRYEEAADAFRDVALLTDTWFGGDAADTHRARMNLANALFEAGKLSEFVEIVRQVHADLANLRGPEAGVTLEARMNYCVGLRLVGDAEAAELCNEELAPRLVAVFGDANSTTLFHDFNRAELFLETDRCRRALDVGRTVRDRMAAVYGADSFFTLTADTLVGAGLAACGDTEAGLELLRRTLTAQLEQAGPSDLQTLTTELRLAHALRVRGQADEALAMVDEALANAHSTLAPAHYLIRDLEAERAAIGGATAPPTEP